MQENKARREGAAAGLVGVYAARLARRAILRRYCQEDHPVLMIEEDLVEMARARLLEHVLPEARDSRAAAVIGAASARVRSSEEEDHVKEAALADLSAMSFEQVLPLLH